MISAADRGEQYLCPFLSVTNNLSSFIGYLEILAQETQTNAGQNNYITRNAALPRASRGSWSAGGRHHDVLHTGRRVVTELVTSGHQ